MSKEYIIPAFAIIIIACIALFVAIASNTNARTSALNLRIIELTRERTALEAEKENLYSVILTLQQEIDYPSQEPLSQTEQPYTPERHPIDQFFYEMAQIISPPCTASMQRFAQIGEMAWRAESDNFFEQLISLTQNELVREWLENERHYYMRYNGNRAQFMANFEASNMFDGDDEQLLTGSIVRILFPSFIGDGLREKALELYARLERIGANPQFIFCEDYYLDILKEDFPWAWEAD